MCAKVIYVMNQIIRICSTGEISQLICFVVTCRVSIYNYILFLFRVRYLLCFVLKEKYLNFVNCRQRPNEKATLGLARVGSRAALNFSFAYLRRAWRSGEDVEFCSELLTESLEALQSLPEATLFDETNVSQVWLEVVERSAKFLRQVVTGYLSFFIHFSSV